jgi:NADH dehydrogenase/NADH:ubiquinone oxidoreductase subunit G
MTEEDVRREARRCLGCGCSRTERCNLRIFAMAHHAEPFRFQGPKRQFDRDDSHPDIVFEPGKCIVCNACVKVAADAHEKLGLASVGRGFQVAVGTPFGESMAQAVRRCARQIVEVCPTGALSLNTRRPMDVGR